MMHSVKPIRQLASTSYQCRHLSVTKLSNKKITRLESDIELDKEQRLINRNPRNLELMSYEYKPKGFWLDKTALCHRYKLKFERNGRYLDAYIQHWSGKKVIKASTRETSLAKYFTGTNTTQAAIVLGHVITRRSLQSGYQCVDIEDLADETESTKTKAFFDAVESSGLTLKEPPEIESRVVTDL